MKRRSLGQHYLVDDEVVRRMVNFAEISSTDRVLEIGTGRGALTRALYRLGASFVGYEIDGENYAYSSKIARGPKVQIRRGDAFERSPRFDVLVASLPYSRSATFIRWLCSLRFKRAIVLLQEDFLGKIVAPPGDREYKGVSALAQVSFQVENLGLVMRSSFKPPPRVNSVIVSFVPKRTISRSEVSNITRLFSLRRRQVDSALSKLGMENPRDHGKERVFSLSPSEVHEICRSRRK